MSNLQKRETSLPDNYNPEKGLKTIVTAEAAEKFFRRAKDSTRLYEAVETKLTEQRNFVLWWDGSGGNLPGKTNRRRPATIKRGDLPVDKDTLHRWRTRLKDQQKFEKSLLAAQERCRRTCEAEKGSTEQKGASGTGENEWYTPSEYIEAARSVLGEIDLDPASSEVAQKTVQATKLYTAEDDGLKQPWNGRVWLNPPYAQPLISDFISKLVEQVSKGNTEAAILLTHNYTDTSWFHEAAAMCSAICFTRGRVKFISSDGSVAAPTQGQAFFYFGTDVAKFAKRFSSIGLVVAPFEELG